MKRVTSWALVALMVASLVGCSGDPFERYCDEVAEQQKPLSEALGEGGPTALLKALPSFEALREKSPADLRDEWDTVVSRIQTFEEALEKADVDPETYDPEKPPEDLSDEAKTRLEAAADQLVEGPMVEALNGVQQQARDVCKNPLSV